MITAIILAAGKSSRARSNKLLAKKNDRAMISYCVEAVQNSFADKVIVITGHDEDKIRAVLGDQDIHYVHNPDYAAGMASSIGVGVKAAQGADAVLICLADMPDITLSHINAIIQNGVDKICFPVKDNIQGHPVLWPKKFFSDLTKLSGDQGAKSLLQKNQKDSLPIQTEDDACFIDHDEDEMIKKWQSII